MIAALSISPALWAQSVLVGSLGYAAGSTPTSRNEIPLANYGPENNNWSAIGFTNGATAQSFVSFNLTATDPSGNAATLEGGIYSDASGAPGTLLGAFSAETASSTPTVYDLQLASGSVVFAANTTYWVVVHDAPAGLMWTEVTGNRTVSTQSGASYLGWNYSSNGGVNWAGASTLGWGGTATVQPQFDLVTSAVPEPSTYAAIFGALALGAVGVLRRRRAVAAQA